MHIFYTPQFGFTWLDTLISQPALIAVHNELERPGIYYVLAFGLPISPHSIVFDPVERDRLVREEIKVRNLGGTAKKSKFPEKFYETANCKTAIIEANRMICTPHMNYSYSLEKRIRDFEQLADASTLSKDVTKNEAELKLAKQAYDMVTKLREDQRKEEVHINKMVSQSGLVSMDMLFDR